MMPAGQVVLLDALIRFKSMRDEMFIWFNMPYPETRQGLAKADESTGSARRSAAMFSGRANAHVARGQQGAFRVGSHRTANRRAGRSGVAAARRRNGPLSRAQRRCSRRFRRSDLEPAFDYERTSDVKVLSARPQGRQPMQAMRQDELTLKNDLPAIPAVEFLPVRARTPERVERPAARLPQSIARMEISIMRLFLIIFKSRLGFACKCREPKLTRRRLPSLWHRSSTNTPF
jgi:hypothetical protein